jgi:hypothetical protein
MSPGSCWPRPSLGLRLAEPHPNQLLALVRLEVAHEVGQGRRYLLWLDGADVLCGPDAQLVRVSHEDSLTPAVLIEDGINIPVLNVAGFDPGSFADEAS